MKVLKAIFGGAQDTQANNVIRLAEALVYHEYNTPNEVVGAPKDNCVIRLGRVDLGSDLRDPANKGLLDEALSKIERRAKFEKGTMSIVRGQPDGILSHVFGAPIFVATPDRRSAQRLVDVAQGIIRDGMRPL